MNSTRRDFLKTAGLLSVAMTGLSFDIKKEKPLLSFSTLGCPDWTFKQIVEFAAKHGYQGLEMRGILRELDLPKCPEFNSSESINGTLRLMQDNGLRFANLGSSAQLHNYYSLERKKNLDDAKRFIDLAQKLNCPYIRVFPNAFPKDQDRDLTIELIVNGLTELGNYSIGSNVKVLMETHGEVVHVADLDKIMLAVSHPQVGLIWDPLNMWTITKEPITMVYEKLKRFIYHAHIKNANLANGKIAYTLMDKGEVPIYEAIDALHNGGYKGFYSFEWEKLWHPEIDAPEIALADYPVAMANHLKKR